MNGKEAGDGPFFKKNIVKSEKAKTRFEDSDWLSKILANWSAH